MPTPGCPASWDVRPAERSSREECITAGPNGYRLLDLEAVIAARGWQWSIKPVSAHPAGRHPKKRFRAIVMASGHDVISDDRRGKSLGMRPRERGERDDLIDAGVGADAGTHCHGVMIASGASGRAGMDRGERASGGAGIAAAMLAGLIGWFLTDSRGGAVVIGLLLGVSVWLWFRRLR
jgi:hypothetical protein